jgi:hypothetical protein
MLLQLLREERAVIPTHHGHAIPKHFLWRPQTIVPTLGAAHVSGFIFQQSMNPNRPISFKPIPSINPAVHQSKWGGGCGFFRIGLGIQFWSNTSYARANRTATSV